MQLGSYEVIGEVNDQSQSAFQQPTESSFSCIACALRFQNLDEMRDHYRTDMHRQNLLRKTEGYVPLNERDLAERKRLADLEAAPKGRLKGQKHKKKFGCAACGKAFSSEKAYEQHQRSKKHLSAAQPAVVVTGVRHPVIEPTKPDAVNDEVDEGSDWGEMEEDEEERFLAAMRARDPLPSNACLFCPEHCDSAEDALEHMEFVHGFHVPDAAYCCDVPGLMEYLAKKVGQGYLCIYCDRVFKSLKAAQMHMVDKGHCKARYLDDVDYDELAEFYDYQAKNEAAEASQMRLKATGEIQLATGRIIGLRQYRTVYRQRLRISAGVDDATVQMALQKREEDIVRERSHMVAARARHAVEMKRGLAFQVRAHKLQTYVRLQL